MRLTDPVRDGGVSAHSLERAGGQQCGSGGVGARARGASGSDRLQSSETGDDPEVDSERWLRSSSAAGSDRSESDGGAAKYS